MKREFTGFYSNEPYHNRPLYEGDVVMVRKSVGRIVKDAIENDEATKWLIHWEDFDEEKGIPEWSYLIDFIEEVTLKGGK